MPDDGSAAYLKATARACAGAIIFAFPLLMTMEMWFLGFTMDRTRLLIFLLGSLPVLVGLSHYCGFEGTFDWREDAMDALTAFAVGALTAAALLTLFGVVTWDMQWREIVGKIAVQTVPAAIGAMLARKQLGTEKVDQERRKRQAGYLGTVFLMGVGALFLAFNVAPTEEMVLIAYKMTPWHGLALMTFSIVMMHAFVYTIGFYGERRHEHGLVSTFFRFTLVGYAVALLVSLFVLWLFGRSEGHSLLQVAMPAVVLAFPAALGAATMRLIL